MVTYHSSNPSIIEYDNWLSEKDIEEILSKDYNWKEIVLKITNNNKKIASYIENNNL
jgi:hypothetical protein